MRRDAGGLRNVNGPDLDYAFDYEQFRRTQPMHGTGVLEKTI